MANLNNSIGSVSQIWSDFAHARLAPGSVGWRFAMDHPRVRAFVYNTYLGGKDPFGMALSTLLPPSPIRALEIGCGGGDLAIGLAKSGRFERIDAYDLSTGAIELARRKAFEAGVSNVNFEVRDCNEISSLDRKYNFVYASHALHHIEALETLFSQVSQVIDEDGIFFADDYIGPSRMQYTDTQIDIMNGVLHDLPTSKKFDAWFDDRIKTGIERVPIEDYIRIDPSEGVRAGEIVNVMSRYFWTKTIPMGLSIAYELLSGIVRNFDPDNSIDNAEIDKIMEADFMASSNSDVPVCFGVLIGRKNMSPLAV